MSEILKDDYRGHFITGLYKHNYQYNLINFVNDLIKHTCVEEFIKDWLYDETGHTDCTIQQSERYEQLLLLQSKINQFKTEYKHNFKKGGK